MWELSVYYCSNCGYYAFQQPPDVPVCQKCSNPMTLLNMHYQDFMNLSYAQRDLAIIQDMLQASPTLTANITAPQRLYYKRELVGAITQQVLELEQEIHELNDTIEWMHSLIWEDFYKKHQMNEEIKRLKDALRSKNNGSSKSKCLQSLQSRWGKPEFLHKSKPRHKKSRQSS